MGQGDHDRGRQAGTVGRDEADISPVEARHAGPAGAGGFPPLPARLADFDGVHSCCAAKPMVSAYGWRWLFAWVRERRAGRRAV